MTREKNSIDLNLVSDYYTRKLEKHGCTSKGVDWNSKKSQEKRFIEISKILPSTNRNFSLCDLGCGFGSYYDFLSKRYVKFKYFGYDISKDMILKAKKRNIRNNNAYFFELSKIKTKFDYIIASGIFNVKLENKKNEWEEYIHNTLRNMSLYAKKGFAFNCLTSYSDSDKQQENLYYGDPLYYFDFCKKTFSRNVSLLHDYNLWEFTILVKME